MSRSTTPQSLVGQVVDGRYRILELLSEGGMGRVYVAEHLTLKMPVAFKVVRADMVGNAELATRFAREAMVTSTIDHPNVVSAIDYGTLPDRGAYLVMQLVRGSTLSAVLAKHGSMHWARAADIAAQIADALITAHGHGIVHRDLKPDNILLQPREGGGDLVKILDFGVARYEHHSLPVPRRGGGGAAVEGKLTQSGALVGTPGYMAPEQAAGDAVGQAADLYALGVILWEMIVGRSPFEAEQVRALLHEQLTRAVPPLREATGDLTLPEELELVCSRLCAIEPAERPQDAGAVRDLLRRVATRAVANAPPSREEIELMGGVERADATGSGLHDRDSTTGDGRRTPWLVGAGVAAAVLVGGLLVLLGQLEVTPKGRLQQTVKTIRPGGSAGAPQAAPPDTPRAAAPSATAAAPASPDGRPTPAAEAPTVAVPAAVDAVAPARVAPDAVAPANEPEPDPLLTYLRVLEAGSDHASRIAAAGALLATSSDGGPPLPAYPRALSELQVTSDCAGLTVALEALADLEQPRALDALSTLADHPGALCGPAHGADCTECLQGWLKQLPRLRVSWGARAGP